MSIIANKVDRSLKRTETICPHCDSGDTKVNTHSQTLVGGNPDPNHHTIHATCNTCSKDFFQEYKYANVWYSETLGKEKKLLKGRPSCFESWVYTCKCGGDFRRTKTQLDGASELKYETIPKNHRTFWECNKCNAKEETEYDYPGDGIWSKTHVDIDKNIGESKNTYISHPYMDAEEFKTKNVLRFIYRFSTQSIWYSNDKNEWERRAPFKMAKSIKKTKMYYCKDWYGVVGWTFNLPWKVYESVGMAVFNSKGISKLTI